MANHFESDDENEKSRMLLHSHNSDYCASCQESCGAHFYNPICNLPNFTSRPCSYHSEDYDLSTDLLHKIEKNKLRSKESVDDNDKQYFKLQSFDSLYSTGVYKSQVSLSSIRKSRRLSGTDIITPVAEINICRIIDSPKKQRKSSLKKKLFCWLSCFHKTCSFFHLLSVFLFLTGLLAAIFCYLIQIIAEGLDYRYANSFVVVCSNATASAMMFCGLFVFCFTPQKKRKIRIVIVLILSLVCTIFCATSLFYLRTKVKSYVSQLEICSFNTISNICSCYFKSTDKEKDPTYRFVEVQNCTSVKKNLDQFVNGVCALFGIGVFISLVTAIVSCYMLKNDRGEELREVIVQTDSSEEGSRNHISGTQESSFTAPSRNVIRAIRPSKTNKKKTTHNFSVATQTPALTMLPAHDPPPPYSPEMNWIS